MDLSETILCLPYRTAERVKVVIHPGGNGFDIPFPFGTIVVPDTPDGYCISSGCGSGKTESIKSLIRQKWDQGILYCVDTKNECSRMYQWIMDNLIGEILHGETLKSNDVLMIHSDTDFEKMKEYKTHPELVIRVRILIITHVRFFTDLIDYFLLYEPNNPNPVVPIFDSDFKKLMQQDNLRKYILLDETPLFLRPFITFPKGLLGVFSEKNKLGDYQCKSQMNIKDAYDTFIKGDSLDFYKGTDRLSQIKRDVILGLIPKYYSDWMGMKDKNCNIHFYPSDLIHSNMGSHVIIYEGAGDVLLGKSSCFKLLDIIPKYNSQVNFMEFPLGLSRKHQPDNTEYTQLVKFVCSLCYSSFGKTLIVIWKDYRTDDERTLTKEAGKSEWADKLREALLKEGLAGSNFTVTYYGASDTKSTNTYRDYQNIILCGNWDLPPSVSGQLRKAYNSKTSQDEYKFWYTIQLLSRIGIRKNDGQKYTVYYSSDHSKKFIKSLDDYLNKNKITMKSKKTTTDPVWMARVKSIKGGNKYVDKIGKLIKYNPALEKAINGDDKTFQMYIPLNVIGGIIPMGGKKQRSNYKRLIDFMKNKLGISLSIPDNRKFVKPKP